MVDPTKHAEFHERQTVAMNAVLAQAAACVPRSWRAATLELEVAFSPVTKIRTIRHRLHNPAAHARISKFSEALFQATTALHTVFTEYDQAWVRGTLTMKFDAAGRLTGYKMNYAYDPEARDD